MPDGEAFNGKATGRRGIKDSWDTNMEQLLWILGFVGIWLLLQLVVLPKFGVDT